MLTDNDNYEPCVERHFVAYMYSFFNKEPTFRMLGLKETGLQILFLPWNQILNPLVGNHLLFSEYTLFYKDPSTALLGTQTADSLPTRLPREELWVWTWCHVAVFSRMWQSKGRSLWLRRTEWLADWGNWGRRHRWGTIWYESRRRKGDAPRRGERKS